MFKHPFRRWMRYAASVPTGFLRYYVIKSLKENPMSGSEIMERIERETNGRWKPSPGSVYPLLAWLQDNGYTKEIPTEETGIKRYTLTEKGEQLFQEQTKLKEKLQERLQFLAPPFLLPQFFGEFLPEKLLCLQEPIRRFGRAFFDLRTAIAENPTEHALTEVAKFLEITAEKIEGVTKDIKERKT